MVMDDLNGDGYLDIATGDGLGSTITIFLNDGAGNLRPGGNRTVQAGDYLNSIDGGDFDGDGDIDLVTAAIQDRRMQVFLNNGQGGYGARSLYTTGVRPFMVEVGELLGVQEMPQLMQRCRIAAPCLQWKTGQVNLPQQSIGFLEVLWIPQRLCASAFPLINEDEMVLRDVAYVVCCFDECHDRFAFVTEYGDSCR